MCDKVNGAGRSLPALSSQMARISDRDSPRPSHDDPSKYSHSSILGRGGGGKGGGGGEMKGGRVREEALKMLVQTVNLDDEWPYILKGPQALRCVCVCVCICICVCSCVCACMSA